MKITTVDTHTEGQSTRTIVSGLGEVAGATLPERRDDFRRRYDHIRTGLLREPRGHPGMFGCALVEPVDPSADFGCIFMHNGGYVDVSGHGAIGVATALVEAGIVEADGKSASVALETPAGLVRARVRMSAGRARAVELRTVAAWVGMSGASVRVPGHGEVIVDVAYAGNLFVWAWAEHLGVELSADSLDRIAAVAVKVLKASNDKLVIRDPQGGDRRMIDVVAILDTPHHELPALRGVSVYGGIQLDRSPGGAAASARLAVMFERGEILADQDIVVESAITNRTLRARIVGEQRAGTRHAVLTEVVGRAHVTGIHDFMFDADDPLNPGFVIGGQLGP